MSLSASVAATVSTTVVSTLFSAMVNVWSSTTGASFSAVTLMVTPGLEEVTMTSSISG